MTKKRHLIGYGPTIISMIEAICNNIEAQIKVNRNMSQSFPAEKGVRQGCPLSMILYTILAENEKITGIKVGPKEKTKKASLHLLTIQLST